MLEENFDELLEFWANQWALEHDTELEWHDYNGERFSEKHSRLNIKLHRLTAISKPVKKTEFQQIIKDTAVAIKSIEKSISNMQQLIDQGWIVADRTSELNKNNEKSPFEYSKVITRARTQQLSVTKTLKVSGTLKFTVGLPSVVGGDFALGVEGSSQKGTTDTLNLSESITIKKAISCPPNTITTVSVLIYEVPVEAKQVYHIVLQGFVVICCKSKIKYKGGQGEHKKWAIPIDEVFQDLLRYKDLTNSPIEQPINLKERLTQFTLEKAKEISFSAEMSIHTTSSVDSFIYTESNPAEAVREDRRPEVLRSYMEEYHGRSLSIKRLFHDAMPIGQYYINLAVVEGRHYQVEVDNLRTKSILKTTEKENVLENDYTNLFGHTTNIIKAEEILARCSRPDKKILITGTAGVGKSTLSEYLLHLAAKGRDIYLLPKMPSGNDFDNYRQSYIFISQQRLVYVGDKVEEVNIGNFSKFNSELMTLNTLNSHKLHLTPTQVNKLITLNGGYCHTKNNLESDYRWILRVPLRNLLNKNKYSENSIITLFDILKKESLCINNTLTLNEAEELSLKHDIEENEKNGKVLYILDGYDEICENLTEHLIEVFKKLLCQRNVILTSRAYNLLSLRDVKGFDFKYEVHLEVTGFTQHNIEQYVKNFFKQPDTDKTECINPLITFIKSNPGISGLCRIPVNLELVCNAWEEQPSYMANGIFSMARLYHTVIISLSMRFLEKNSLLSLNEMSNTIKEKALDRCQDVLIFLERFSFDGFTNQSIFYGLDQTLKYVEMIEDNRQIIGRLKGFGLIKPNNPHNRYDAVSDYYFSHLTFRDLFLARYLVICLQKEVKTEAEYRLVNYTHAWKHPEKLSIREFINRNKFNGSFEIVLWLISGLLSLMKDTQTITCFLSMLMEEPHDISTYSETLILIRCVDEMQNEVYKLDKNIQERLWRQICGWIQLSLETNSVIFKDNQPNMLWGKLKLSPWLCQQKRVQSILYKKMGEIQNHNCVAEYLLKIEHNMEAALIYLMSSSQDILTNHTKAKLITTLLLSPEAQVKIVWLLGLFKKLSILSSGNLFTNNKISIEILLAIIEGSSVAISNSLFCLCVEKNIDAIEQEEVIQFFQSLKESTANGDENFRIKAIEGIANSLQELYKLTIFSDFKNGNSVEKFLQVSNNSIINEMQKTLLDLAAPEEQAKVTENLQIKAIEGIVFILNGLHPYVMTIKELSETLNSGMINEMYKTLFGLVTATVGSKVTENLKIMVIQKTANSLMLFQSFYCIVENLETLLNPWLSKTFEALLNLATSAEGTETLRIAAIESVANCLSTANTIINIRVFINAKLCNVTIRGLVDFRHYLQALKNPKINKIHEILLSLAIPEKGTALTENLRIVAIDGITNSLSIVFQNLNDSPKNYLQELDQPLVNKMHEALLNLAVSTMDAEVTENLQMKAIDGIASILKRCSHIFYTQEFDNSLINKMHKTLLDLAVPAEEIKVTENLRMKAIEGIACILEMFPVMCINYLQESKSRHFIDEACEALLSLAAPETEVTENLRIKAIESIANSLMLNQHYETPFHSFELQLNYFQLFNDFLFSEMHKTLLILATATEETKVTENARMKAIESIANVLSTIGQKALDLKFLAHPIMKEWCVILSNLPELTSRKICENLNISNIDDIKFMPLCFFKTDELWRYYFENIDILGNQNKHYIFTAIILNNIRQGKAIYLLENTLFYYEEAEYKIKEMHQVSIDEIKENFNHALHLLNIPAPLEARSFNLSSPVENKSEKIYTKTNTVEPNICDDIFETDSEDEDLLNEATKEFLETRPVQYLESEFWTKPTNSAAGFRVLAKDFSKEQRLAAFKFFQGKGCAVKQIKKNDGSKDLTVQLATCCKEI